MATHDVVLGLPWLQEHNPAVDWKAMKVLFASKRCRTHHQISRENPNLAKQLVR